MDKYVAIAKAADNEMIHAILYKALVSHLHLELRKYGEQAADLFYK